ERNREYQCFNTGGHPVCIEPLSEMQNSIDQLLERLAADRDRLRSKRSERDAETKWLDRLVHRLFEIRHQHLNTWYPLQSFETPRSGKFRTYITLCLRCAGVPEHQIDGAIKGVTAKYAREPKRNW